MTILAIYAAGAIFFLIQAHIYARVTRERIKGALTWPVLIFALPHIIRMIRIQYRREAATLAHDESMAIKSIHIGDRWGIGK